MRWIVKAVVQDVLSVVPRGEAVNYLLQRHVTGGLPASDVMFRMHVDEAVNHFRALRDVEPEDAVLFEFGAGWDLIGPITLAALGISRQIVVDIRANLRLSLVNDTIARLPPLLPQLERETGRPLRDLQPEPISTIADLERRFGVRYLAPCDARRTGLPSASVDAVTSTFTLEHIPAPDIRRILEESARILKSGGLVSCAIDMKDHYSYFDGRLGPYHFLTIPDSYWRLVNPPLHYQNRLRLSDYRRLFAEAGLSIVEETVKRPTEVEQRALESLKLAPRFRDRPLEDVAAQEVRVVARARA